MGIRRGSEPTLKATEPHIMCLTRFQPYKYGYFVRNDYYYEIYAIMSQPFSPFDAYSQAIWLWIDAL